MAGSAKGAEARALNMLTPNAVKMTVGGSEIRVASNKDENAVMNMIVVSQMRNLIQENIKKYKEQDIQLTPKELKELADAAKSIADFSLNVYKDAEPLKDRDAKGVKKDPTDVNAISFDAIATVETPAGVQAAGTEGESKPSGENNGVDGDGPPIIVSAGDSEES